MLRSLAQFFFFAGDLFNAPIPHRLRASHLFTSFARVARFCPCLFGLFKRAIHKSDRAHNGLICVFKISIMAWGLLCAHLVSGSCRALRFDFRSYRVVRQRHDLHRSPLHATVDCVLIQLRIARTSPCAEKGLLTFNPPVLTWFCCHNARHTGFHRTGDLVPLFSHPAGLRSYMYKTNLYAYGLIPGYLSLIIGEVWA